MEILDEAGTLTDKDFDMLLKEAEKQACKRCGGPAGKHTPACPVVTEKAPILEGRSLISDLYLHGKFPEEED